MGLGFRAWVNTLLSALLSERPYNPTLSRTSRGGGWRFGGAGFLAYIKL